MKEEWVRVKFHDIISRTEKAVLFLFEQEEIWLPIKLFRFAEGRHIRLPKFLAKDKNLKICFKKPEYHQPQDIEPIFNQESINELKYEKIS